MRNPVDDGGVFFRRCIRRERLRFEGSEHFLCLVRAASIQGDS